MYIYIVYKYGKLINYLLEYKNNYCYNLKYIIQNINLLLKEILLNNNVYSKIKKNKYI